MFLSYKNCTITKFILGKVKTRTLIGILILPLHVWNSYSFYYKVEVSSENNLVFNLLYFSFLLGHMLFIKYRSDPVGNRKFFSFAPKRTTVRCLLLIGWRYSVGTKSRISSTSLCCKLFFVSVFNSSTWTRDIRQISRLSANWYWYWYDGMGLPNFTSSAALEWFNGGDLWK